MKFFLSIFVFSLALSEITAAQLNITVFYQSLCVDSIYFITKQLWPVYQNPNIRDKVFVELVPFGRANFTEKPFRIHCQHGEFECLGNVLAACFISKNPNNYEQVAMISCCLSYEFPPMGGPKCAQILGYSYEGIKECSNNKEGIALQIKNGRRTLGFKPKIEFIPTIVYNNVYNKKDHEESLTNFRAVVMRKLKGKSKAD